MKSLAPHCITFEARARRGSVHRLTAGGREPVHISDQDVLIVVDVQNDFTRGSMAIPGSSAIIEPINQLAAQFSNVVIVTDWHPPGHISFASAHGGRQPGDEVIASYGAQAVFANHCVQGSWGAELDADLRVGMAQLILRKGFRRTFDSYGCFYENDHATGTGLTEYLRARGIRRVLCAGLARFGCVMHSALGAARDGFDVAIVDDASAGRPCPTDDAARVDLAQAGVAWIRSRDLMAG